MLGYLRRAWERLRTEPAAPKCAHAWRPAVSKSVLGRFCSSCETLENLTPPQFYEQFGEAAMQRAINWAGGKFGELGGK